MLNKEVRQEDNQARHETNDAGVRTRFTAGCLPYRQAEESGDVELLLITARKRDDWIFPKGGWEAEESSEEAALRETREEAGVCGNIVFTYEPFEFTTKKGKNTRMHYYLLQVTNILYDFQEVDQRQRKWFPLSELDTSFFKRTEYQTMFDRFVASQPHCFEKQGAVAFEDTVIAASSSLEALS